MTTTKTRPGSTTQSTQYDGGGTEAVSIEELLSGEAFIADPAELMRNGFVIEELGPLQVGTPMEVMADVQTLIEGLISGKCSPEGLEKAVGKVRRLLVSYCSLKVEDLEGYENDLKCAVDFLTGNRNRIEHEVNRRRLREDNAPSLREVMKNIAKLTRGIEEMLRAVREQLRARLPEPVMANA